MVTWHKLIGTRRGLIRKYCRRKKCVSLWSSVKTFLTETFPHWLVSQSMVNNYCVQTSIVWHSQGQNRAKTYFKELLLNRRMANARQQESVR